MSEIIALRAELATLRAEAARLREALEAIKGINYSAGYLPPHEPNAAKAIDIARHALDSTPTTAEWLAARDEEMKRLGAAEWLEKTSAENLERFGTHFYESTTDSMLTEAARLRKGVENGR